MDATSPEGDNDRYYRDLPSLKHNLSFAGCGFLGLYHVGVCCCMRKFAPHLYQNRPISGASAGALSAACLVCDVSIAEIVQYICELIKNCRQYFLGPFDPRFKINEHLREGLSRILPSDAHVLCSGRLSISLTSYATHKNVVVNRFKDRDELISAILCSTFIPIFSGFMPAVFRGQPVLDGGFSDNLLCLDRTTLTVSPFYGEADICPMNAHWDGKYSSPAPHQFEDWFGTICFLNNTMRLNWTNLKRFISMLWPMSPEELTSLAAQGYADALRFLITRGFIACRIHQTPRSFVQGRRYSGVPPPQSPQLRRQMTFSNLPTSPLLAPVKKLVREPRAKTKRHRTTAPAGPRRSLSVAGNLDLTDLAGVGLGLNVASCFACREELRKARNSKLPAFLRSIIMGGVRAHRPKSDYSYLQASKQTWTVITSILHQSAAHLCSFVHNMFYQPIIFQLDLLIRIIAFAISVCGKCWLVGEPLHSLLSSLEKAREMLARSKSAYECDTRIDAQWDIPTTGKNLYAIHEVHRHRRRRSSRLGDHIQSVVDTSTNNISDFLFRYSPFQLPTAEECGLELFGTSDSDFVSRQVNPLTRQRSPPPSTSSLTYLKTPLVTSGSELHEDVTTERGEEPAVTSCTSSASIPISPSASDNEGLDEIADGTLRYIPPSPPPNQIRFSISPEL